MRCPSTLKLLVVLVGTALLPEAAPADGRQNYVVDVVFDAPEGATASTVSLEVEYPQAELEIPGTRNDPSVRERLADLPASGVQAVNDAEGLVRLVLAGTSALTPGMIASIRFDRIGDEPSVSAAKLGCRVIGCAGANGAVKGCTCRIRSR